MAGVIKYSDSQLRQLQLVLIEMIAEVDRVCRKNKIQYSLDGGTLLGAVRDHGVIPWDDDADVIFTREEYSKFAIACKTDLDTTRFFLQDYQSDPDYRWGYAKLRRRRTEFVRSGQEQMHYKTGICIDIFVLDNVPDNRITRELYHDFMFFIRKALYSELGREAAPNMFMRGCYSILHLLPKDLLFAWRNYFAFKCNQHRTALKDHLMYPYTIATKGRNRYGVPAVFFDSYTDIDFEGMKMRCIKEYDAYLTMIYGDYMTPPPMNERKGPGEPSKLHLIDLSLEEIQRRYMVKD